jgi:hypothetical protein
MQLNAQIVIRKTPPNPLILHKGEGRGESSGVLEKARVEFSL